jgi:hypothetical protein
VVKGNRNKLPDTGVLGGTAVPFSQDPRYLYFLMEYIPGGELFTYLRTEGKLNPDHAKYAPAYPFQALLGAGGAHVRVPAQQGHHL